MSTWVAKDAPGVEQLLFRLVGANMNVTTDQVMAPYSWPGPGSLWMPTRIIATNASLSLSVAAGGIYPAAAKAGNPIVAAAQAYAAANAVGAGLELTLAALGRGYQSATPILSLTTAQGAAATADFYVFGIMQGNL